MIIREGTNGCAISAMKAFSPVANAKGLDLFFE